MRRSVEWTATERFRADHDGPRVRAHVRPAGGAREAAAARRRRRARVRPAARSRRRAASSATSRRATSRSIRTSTRCRACSSCCVQGGDLFTIERTVPTGGRRPARPRAAAAARASPIVYAGLIVKNEERDLPRCLASIGRRRRRRRGRRHRLDRRDARRSRVDHRASPCSRRPTPAHRARTRRGDWKLWDFGKARNVFVEEIERRGADYVLWMDADDELLTPANLRRAVYWGEFDVFGVQIESGGQRWTHHRLWKTRPRHPVRGPLPRVPDDRRPSRRST